jgi:N-methylhydantoinase A/oxoprolinase/acetone carboxylase beta subunit
MPSILDVDAGGTFTDFLLWQNSLPASGRGGIAVYKRPSTREAHAT